MAFWDANSPLKLEGRTVELGLRQFELYRDLNDKAAELLAMVSDEGAYASAVGQLRARFETHGLSAPPLPEEYSADGLHELVAHCRQTQTLFKAVAAESGLGRHALMQMERQ